MKRKSTKQTRIDRLNMPKIENELSHSDDDDLYRFLRGGLGAK
ncbi:MAG TPA: hypothetical protein VMC84_07045 [Methanocella sp.]|nr:hypothetical protein [Methanocella sp.]HTY90919.1 hypothetical protein [Methanocella sp.]